MSNLMKLFILTCLAMSAIASEIVPGHLFVKIQEGAELPKSELIKNAKNLFKNYYLVKTTDAKKLASELKSEETVLQTDFNYKTAKRELAIKEDFVPAPLFESFANSPFNDPRVGNLWAFNSSGENGISINKAYRDTTNSPISEVIVAVVDTGVDYDHKDLAENIWINEGEIAGNGIDDDGNGYIDDIHGIDTLHRDSEGNATGDPDDSHGHGTHVSGTIAAVQNNNIGIAGIASNAKIMAIRTVPNNGDETDVDVVESFLYAAKHGAKIINCSFGKANNEGGMIVSETIAHIGEEYGVLVIAAAGNSTQNIDERYAYPASFPNDHLLVVASTTNRGSFSYFSNYGLKNVDLAAPGSGILSTVRNDRYASYSGTSMASPNTAGVAAHLLSYDIDLGPLELKALLMDTVNASSRYSGRIVTGGRVDLYNALQKLN